MHPVPFEPAAIALYPTIGSWSAEAPGIVAHALERWNLTAGEAFVGGVSGSVLRVRTPSGDDAILKVGYPHAEATWEAVGLGAFPVGTAPRVLEQDAWTWSMLLEPVLPGQPLSAGQVSGADLIAASTLLARLWTGTVPAGLPTLSEAMGGYAAAAMERQGDQSPALDSLGVNALVRDAIAVLAELAAADSARAGVLLHGDFNPGNILRGSGQTLVAVDPKPLVGDAAFDLWPLVTQFGSPMEDPDPVASLHRALALAATTCGVEVAGAALWAFARSGLNVSWYLADGLPAQAAIESRALRAWAVVAGR
jgi:streptomycin 6-kinase